MVSKQTELPKTLQDWFDVAWDWAVVEKHPQCMDANGNCYYRYDGNACLIGAGIPDSLYQPRWDCGEDGVYQPKNASDILTALEQDASLVMQINALQRCHDQATGITHEDYLYRVERRLRDFASADQLSVPV